MLEKTLEKLRFALSQLGNHLDDFLFVVFRIFEKNILFFDGRMQLIFKSLVYLFNHYFTVCPKNRLNTVVKDCSHLIKIFFFNNSGVKRLIRFQHHNLLLTNGVHANSHVRIRLCRSVCDYQNLLV